MFKTFHHCNLAQVCVAGDSSVPGDRSPSAGPSLRLGPPCASTAEAEPFELFCTHVCDRVCIL